VGKTSSPTVLYPVTLFLCESYPLGSIGSVHVYQLESQDERRFEGFLVTLGDGFTENVWGHGNTPLEALQDAEESWRRIAGDEYENPFSLALRRREEQEDWRWS